MISTSDLFRIINKRIREEEYDAMPLIEVAMVAQPIRYGLLDVLHIRTLEQAEEFRNQWLQHYDQLVKDVFPSVKDLEDENTREPKNTINESGV